MYELCVCTPSIPKFFMVDFFDTTLTTHFIQIIEKIKYIIKIYYITNYTLVKIINNFNFLNKMSV
jgi:hypothetical protein